VNARILLAAGAVLLALSASTARACNVTADVDHAVRMTQASAPARTVLSSTHQTSKVLKAKTSRYANYPR
jgi:hypothetical protein